jgi:hypothetical protein
MESTVILFCNVQRSGSMSTMSSGIYVRAVINQQLDHLFMTSR